MILFYYFGLIINTFCGFGSVLYKYVVNPISFLTFLYRHLKLSRALVSYVIVVHLMRWQTIFYDFRFKWTATTAIGIHPTEARLSHLVNFKNAIWTWGHFWRTICNKIMFKTWKNTTEMYGMSQTAFRPSCMNQASVFEWHWRFKGGR